MSIYLIAGSLLAGAVFLFLTLKIFVKLRLAPSRLRGIHRTEGPQSAADWLLANKLRPLDPPFDPLEVEIASAAVFFAVLLCCLLFVPWSPETIAGEIVRIAVYIVVALGGFVAMRIGLDFAAEGSKNRFERTIDEDPEYSELRGRLDEIRQKEYERLKAALFSSETITELDKAGRAFWAVRGLAVPRLIDELRDAGPDKKAKAAHALGFLGDQSAVGPLSSLARQGDRFRLECGNSLARLGNDLGVQILLSLVTSYDASLRNQAFAYLSSTFDWYKSTAALRAVPVLIKALKSTDARVLLTVVKALDKIDQDWHSREGCRDAATFLGLVMLRDGVSPEMKEQQPIYDALKKIDEHLWKAVLLEPLQGMSIRTNTSGGYDVVGEPRPQPLDLSASLTAQLVSIATEFKVKFAQLLAEVLPAIDQPLKLSDYAGYKDDPIVAERFEHYLKTVEPENSEEYLLKILENAPVKSQQLEKLGNWCEKEGDLEKAAAYHLLAVYSMSSPYSPADSFGFLSGLYAECGEEGRSRTCGQAALNAAAGEGASHPNDSRLSALRKGIADHPIIKDLADRAWPSITDNLSSIAGPEPSAVDEDEADSLDGRDELDDDIIPDAPIPDLDEPESEPVPKQTEQVTAKNYLYVLRTDQSPTQEMMQQVLTEYQKIYQNVSILGGQRHAGSLPSEPDTFVVVTCLALCSSEGVSFESDRDQIAYNLDSFAGEMIGVCRIQINLG